MYFMSGEKLLPVRNESLGLWGRIECMWCFSTTHIIQLLQVKHHPVGHSSAPEPNVCLLLSASLLSWNTILLHALEQVKTHTCTHAHTHTPTIYLYLLHTLQFYSTSNVRKKHTQRGAILVCPSLRGRSKQNDFYVFLKKTHKTPFLWPQKTVIIISIDRFQNMAMKKEIKKIKITIVRSTFYALGEIHNTELAFSMHE